MQIGTDGWSNLQTRSADSIDVPEKVYVGKDGKHYEYSEIPPAHSSWDIHDILNGPNGRQNFITLFYSIPEIFAPVNEIASRVADATWQLCANRNDQVDYNNKDFNRLFERPNVLMTHKEFVWQAVCYKLLTGANFQYFNKPSYLPNEISSILGWWNAPTHKVTIDKKKDVDVYSATAVRDFVNKIEVTENGKKRELPIENVLSFIKLDLKEGNQIDKYKSDLCGAHVAIKNLIAVYEARGVIYIKRGALGFIVSKKSDESGLISLTKAEKEEAQKEFQNTYGLSNNKNLVGVSSAPVEYISTSMSIKDLQPFDETLMDAIACYKVLRVPRHFVPSKDNSTFANAESDTRAFYDDVIFPIARELAQSWTTEFAIPNRYVRADFSHVAALKENQKDKSDVDSKNGSTYLQRWQNGVITLNDWITAIDGEKGSGPIYEKKIFDLTPEEVERVKSVINMKLTNTNNNTKENGTTPEDQGTEA